MATVYSNINMVAFTRAQVRKAAASLGIYVDNSKTTPTILAAVKAK